MRRVLAGVGIAALAAVALGGTSGTARDVVLVANAEGGTVTAVDATSFDVLHQLDVVPDGDEAQPGQDDPVQATLGQRIVEAAGGENLAQDQDLAPDGRTLYVSRGHRGDVAAFDLVTDDLLWKTPVDGLRADHATLSADGSRLYVSDLTNDVVQVLDTADGDVVGTAATGEWPHDNHLSEDGQRLYNASIGNIVTPRESRQVRVAAPGVPSPYQVRVIDSGSLEVLQTFELDNAVRPFAVASDESRLFAQLSEFHGVVELDLADGTVSRRLELPIDDGVTEDDYSFEAPHHGLALSADEQTLCLAGRASDYVAFVDVERFEALDVVEVDDAPSWALTTPDGEHCVAANTRGGTVSFLSYATHHEVARVATGLGPKHLEAGAVPGDVLAAWAGSQPADAGASGSAAPDRGRTASDPAGGVPLAATGGTLLAPALVLVVGAVVLRPGRRGRSR